MLHPGYDTGTRGAGIPRPIRPGITGPASHGKNDLDTSNWRRCAPVRLLLGAVMEFDQTRPTLLDVVALLQDVPEKGLARGQVGTVVENLGEDAALVEFSDDEGRAFAI